MTTAVVRIRVCDLAAIAGRHPYRPQREELDRLRARCEGGLVAERRHVASQRLKGVQRSVLCKTAKQMGIACTTEATEGVLQDQMLCAVDNATLKVAKMDQTERACARLCAEQGTREALAKKRLADHQRDHKKEPDGSRRRTTACSTASNTACAVALAAAATAAASASHATALIAKLLAQKAQGTLATMHANADMRRVVQERMRMAEGVVNESDILGMLRSRYADLSDAARPDTPFPWCMSLGTTSSGKTIVLAGVVDALCHSSNTIVEIKRRKNRLFRRVVEYEKVQVMAYMAMRLHNRGACDEFVMEDEDYHEDDIRGELVEEYGGALMRHRVCWNATEWESIVKDVHVAIDGL